VEVADIFRAHGTAYRHAHALSRAQRRAMQAIETCRTAALGGHRETCDTCGAARIAYNSCRDRHCPKCQTLAKERWLAARRAELLPVEYFHVVFTLPHALNPLAQGNPRVIYTLLFRAVAATLTTFGRDRRHLGGDLGGTAILHTWGQNLSQHLHLHCVVAGGALTQDGTRWISAPHGFLFPVRALARVFRGKYLGALRRASPRASSSSPARSPPSRIRRPSRPGFRSFGSTTGSSTRNGPSPDRRRSWSTSDATRTAWRSPTSALSAPPTASCASAGETTPMATASRS